MSPLLPEEALAGGRAIKWINEEITSSGMNEPMRAFILLSHNGVSRWEIRKDPTLTFNV
jgi:hypothetical protein